MATNYDKLYGSSANALGAPTEVFVDFFHQQTQPQLRVLDVGCGQGRDALFIARLGHVVVGVDLSPNGISNLSKAANRENLPITATVADITTYTPTGSFDILLFDRTLHMLPQAQHLAVLSRLIEYASDGSWVLIADERSNMAGFKSVFDADRHDWETTRDGKGYLFLHRRDG